MRESLIPVDSIEIKGTYVRRLCVFCVHDCNEIELGVRFSGPLIGKTVCILCICKHPETVIAFSLEPQGSTFAVIHGEPPTRISVTFYKINDKDTKLSNIREYYYSIHSRVSKEFELSLVDSS